MNVKNEQQYIFKAAAALLLILPLIYLPFTADNFLVKFTLLSTFLTFIIIFKLFSGKVYLGSLALPLGIFIALKGLSVMWSPNRFVALDIFWHDFTLITAGYLIGISLKGKYSHRIIKYIVAGSVIPVLYGIIQFSGLDPVSWGTDFAGRIGSSLGNPVFFSGYLIAVFPLNLYYLIHSKNKYIPAIILILSFSALLLTGTRSSFVAFFVQIIILILLVNNKIIKRYLFIGCGLSIIVIISFPMTRKRISDAFSLESSSVSQRIFKWKTAIRMFKDSPILGRGVGGVKTEFALYQGQIQRSNIKKLKGSSESQIHSEYLQILAQNGLIGLLLFIYIMYRVFNNILNFRDKKINLYILAAFSGILIDSVAAFPLYVVPSGFIFFLYAGLTDSVRKEKNVKKATVIIIDILIISGYIGISVLKFYSSYLKKGAASVSRTAPKYAADIYKKAHEIFPADGQSEYKRGLLLYRTGNYNEAIKALKNSVSIRHYSEVYNNLGIIHYKKNNFKKALKYWEKAVELGMPDPEMQDNLLNNVKVVKEKIN